MSIQPGTPRPYILALGGTLRPNSSTEKALRVAVEACKAAGAETFTFGAPELEFPMYAPERPERTPAAKRFVDEVRRADGFLVASPAYHGGLSGLLKNALDYVEDLRDDARPYFDGRAVGCIITAAGWQATGTSLVGLRSIVHTLRGWNTPLGVTINSLEQVFDAEGNCISAPIAKQLEMVGQQVVEFARMKMR